MKRKKHRWIVLLIFLPMLTFIFWSFQTHSPLEKVYSADRQYSYHLEEYNFNKILKELPYHETIYKVFLYNEITQKTLFTKYLGGQTYMRDYFGFSDEDSRLYFDKTDYYELPSPIKRKVVKQQENKDELGSYPLISPEEINTIKPIIRKWTDFYNLDLAQARLVSKDSVCLNCPPDTSNMYYREYTAEQNTSKRIEMFYSPNKRYYIDIGILCESVNGKYYDFGYYDDSQTIYFTDRRLKYNQHLFYFGVSAGVQSVFWKNNNEFFLVGRDFTDESLINFFIYQYNISNGTETHYYIPVSSFGESRSYRLEVVMKEKGIIVSY